MNRRYILVSVHVLALVLMTHADAWAQSPRLRVSTQRDVSDDEKRAWTVTVQLTPAHAATRARDLLVTVDAGTLGTPVSRGPGLFEYPFVPPRVLRARTVSVRASANVGRRTVRARAKIAVQPLKFEPGEHRTNGAFDLHGPRFVRLGVDQTVTLSIRAPSGPRPEIHASVGTVGAWTRVGDRLQAAYKPPSTKFPQFALIAVVSPARRAFDWRVLPLYGRGRLALTSEPHASVRIRVGEHEFGPVQTDRRGKTRLSVWVPPGIQTATTIASDTLGNVEQGTLPLRPPRFKRVLTVCPGTSLRALMFAIDLTGSPLDRAPLELTTDRGRVRDANPVTRGVYATAYTVPEDMRVGDDMKLQARLPGASLAVSECRAKIAGVPPSRIKLALGNEDYVAGSRRALRIQMTSVYTGHLPPLNMPVEWMTSVGTITTTPSDRVGESVAMWSIPDEFGGRTHATATVTSGDLSATATVRLQPGPVARLKVEAADTRLLANGRSTTAITITAHDAFDNLVSGATLSTRARGRITTVVDRGGGVYSATYTAPVSYLHGIDQIRISHTDTGSAAYTEVGLSPLRRSWSVSGRLGYLSNTGKVAAPFIQLGAAMRLPILRDHVRVGVDVGLYSGTDRRVDVDAIEPVDTTITVVPVHGRLSFTWPLGRFSIYGGVAVGIAFGGIEVSSMSSGHVYTRLSHLSGLGVLGIERRLARGHVLLEAGFLYTRVDGLIAIGNAGGTFGTLGYRYEL